MAAVSIKFEKRCGVRSLKSSAATASEQLDHEIRRHRDVIIEYRDAQLKAWIDAGELTQRVAELVRSLWAEQGDRPFHIDDFAMPDGGRADHITRISEIVPPPQPAPIRK